jgi:hypothetical protein
MLDSHGVHQGAISVCLPRSVTSETRCGEAHPNNMQTLKKSPPISAKRSIRATLLDRFETWHAVYLRMNPWANGGFTDRVFEKRFVELRGRSFLRT